MNKIAEQSVIYKLLTRMIVGSADKRLSITFYSHHSPLFHPLASPQLDIPAFLHSEEKNPRIVNVIQ